MDYYICAPANFKSGGPHSLHQLYFEINKVRTVKIYYYNKKSNVDAMPSDYYEKYLPNQVLHIPDTIHTVIIIPESYTQFSSTFKHAKVLIWWLGTTNYYFSRGMLFHLPLYILQYMSIKEMIWIIYKFLTSFKGYIDHYKFISNKNIIHLYGTNFTHKFLHKLNVKNTLRLTQPISSYFMRPILIKKNRENLVLYNPSKISLVLKKLIKNLGNKIKFVPIFNMTEIEVKKIMSTSKIYIDFGYFPGPERLPREAVLCGCVVITSKYGTASSYEDIPLPEEYKFDLSCFNYSKIDKLITEIFRDFDYHSDKMSTYKELVVENQRSFQIDVEYLTNILESMVIEVS